MKSILFVCDANRFRSVIAAEYFRFLLQKNNLLNEWNVECAGTWASEGLLPLQQALSIMKSFGISIIHIRSREVTPDIINSSKLVVVMTDGQKEALSLEFSQVKKHIFLLAEICINQVYDIPDPVKNSEESFEEIGSEICGLLDQGFENICKMS
jgi:protein-tyrosine-phosphatase